MVLLTTSDFDATTVDHNTVTLGDAYEAHRDRRTGEARRHEEDADRDGDIDLVFHFRYAETGLPCYPDVVPFNGYTFDGQPITGGDADARSVGTSRWDATGASPRACASGTTVRTPAT